MRLLRLGIAGKRGSFESADAKQIFGFLHAAGIAEELKRHSAVVFLQHDPQKTKVVTFQPSQNVEFGLSNQFSLEPSRLKAHL